MLGGKPSISGDEYKGLKVVFFDLKKVGDKGVNIHVGVKKSDYSTSYKCDPEQSASLSGDGEMDVTFIQPFKRKNIDLLLPLKAGFSRSLHDEKPPEIPEVPVLGEVSDIPDSTRETISTT